MSEPNALLPCPFCRGAVQFRKALHISDGNVDSIIHAAASICPMVVFEDGSVDERILAKWNTRAAPAQEPVAWPKHIDTAPKDGTEFIGYESGEVYRCAWKSEEPDEGPGYSGWWDFSNESFEEPTEWAPLRYAAPPADAKAADLVNALEEIAANRDMTREAAIRAGNIAHAAVIAYRAGGTSESPIPRANADQAKMGWRIELDWLSRFRDEVEIATAATATLEVVQEAIMRTENLLAGAPKADDALARMKTRLIALAQRFEKEANPEIRDIGDDLVMISNDEDPS